MKKIIVLTLGFIAVIAAAENKYVFYGEKRNLEVLWHNKATEPVTFEYQYGLGFMRILQAPDTSGVITTPNMPDSFAVQVRAVDLSGNVSPWTAPAIAVWRSGSGPAPPPVTGFDVPFSDSDFSDWKFTGAAMQQKAGEYGPGAYLWQLAGQRHATMRREFVLPAGAIGFGLVCLGPPDTVRIRLCSVDTSITYSTIRVFKPGRSVSGAMTIPFAGRFVVMIDPRQGLFVSYYSHATGTMDTTPPEMPELILIQVAK